MNQEAEMEKGTRSRNGKRNINIVTAIHSTPKIIITFLQGVGQFILNDNDEN